MKLIIGGYAQGKLSYVLQKYNLKKSMIWDGVIPDENEMQEETVVINHFHSWVKNSILNGSCLEQEILAFLKKHPNCIIISDEIGNGIVPLEPFEREYR